MLNNKWKKRFKRWFRLRFAILYPLGIWAVIFGHSTDESIMRSIWFILLGLGIRSWANCYAIKMGKLARQKALKRHNTDTIRNQLLGIYKQVIINNK